MTERDETPGLARGLGSRRRAMSIATLLVALAAIGGVAVFVLDRAPSDEGTPASAPIAGDQAPVAPATERDPTIAADPAVPAAPSTPPAGSEAASAPPAATPPTSAPPGSTPSSVTPPATPPATPPTPTPATRRVGPKPTTPPAQGTRRVFTREQDPTNRERKRDPLNLEPEPGRAPYERRK